MTTRTEVEFLEEENRELRAEVDRLRGCLARLADPAEMAAVRAAAEAIDAEFRDAECRSKPRWSRDLAIAALEAGAPHILAAADPGNASVPADDLAVAALIAERATAAVAAMNERFGAEVAKAVGAERERIRQLAITNGAVCTGDEGTSCYFADLIGSGREAGRGEDLIIRWQDVRKGDLVLVEESFAVVEGVRVTPDDAMDSYVGVSYRHLGDDRSYYAACHGNRLTAVRRGCGQCSGGLVDVPGCNCGGGGPDGFPPHGPLCGAEPCPNGCWERLHPAVAEGDGNG